MNVILTLTLTGSCMAMFYCLIKYMPKRYLAHHWGYIWIKIIMLFYLIPLPFLKLVYKSISQRLFGVKNYVQVDYFNDLFDNTVYISEGDTFLSTSYRIQIISIIVWFTVAALIMIRHIIRYLHNRRNLLKCCVPNDDKRLGMLLEELKKEYGIQRNVLLYSSNQKIAPFSIGIWRPVIILCKTNLSETLNIVLSHELIHIKRYDVLYQALDIFLLSIHWFNPLIHWVIKEKERICEMSCDDIVIKNMSLRERTEYASLITRQATYGNTHIEWANNLSKDGRQIEKRIVNIMDKNKKKKLRGLASAIMIGFVTILSSLTVFAYKDVTYFEIQYPEIELENSWAEREMLFMPDGEMGGFQNDNLVIVYEKQFIDEQGNVYEVKDLANSFAVCEHNYQNETYQDYIKYTDSSCKSTNYNAKRCIKCGYIVIIDKISSTLYYSCPH